MDQCPHSDLISVQQQRYDVAICIYRCIKIKPVTNVLSVVAHFNQPTVVVFRLIYQATLHPIRAAMSSCTGRCLENCHFEYCLHTHCHYLLTTVLLILTVSGR